MTNASEHRDTPPQGSGAQAADMATDQSERLQEQRSPEAAHARFAEPVPADEKPDQLAPKMSQAENRQEALLDEAIEESFPGSDPISPKHIT